ncbi:MAG: M56 family metallopeptidase [Gemmatimonadales bacterium]
MIASWLLYTLALSTIVALAARLIEPLIRSRGWRVRNLWAAALLASALVPAALALRPRAPIQPLAAEPGGNRTLIAEPIAAAPDLDRPLGAIWIVGSGLVLALVAGGLLQLRAAVRRARRIRVDGTPVALTDRLGPGATAFGEPRILVPEWFRSLPRPAQRLLVLHEREHLTARDPQWLLGGWLVLALVPWNPIAWWMLLRLARAIETDCDARVLGRAPVRPYGELLLEVAGRVARPPLVGMLAFTRSGSELKERIDRMTLPRRPLGPVRQLTLGGVAALALVAACEMPAPDPVGPTTDAKAEAPAIASKVIARHPVVVVRNAAGSELYRDHAMPALVSDDIARIEVLKGRELTDDLIEVTLKQDVTFDGAAAKVNLHLIQEVKEAVHAKEAGAGGRVSRHPVELRELQSKKEAELHARTSGEIRHRVGTDSTKLAN